uniref:Uncharacterized protein n=1 Tax=Glossina morsitans morsitans TaxID=37546 RepID=A0A1B0GG04_GLOMM
MVLISEMSYVIMATMNTEHFVKVIVNLSYIRVVGVETKTRRLYKFYPKRNTNQKAYQVMLYPRNYRRTTMFYTFIHESLILTQFAYKNDKLDSSILKLRSVERGPTSFICTAKFSWTHWHVATISQWFAFAPDSFTTDYAFSRIKENLIPDGHYERHKNTLKDIIRYPQSLLRKSTVQSIIYRKINYSIGNFFQPNVFQTSKLIKLLLFPGCCLVQMFLIWASFKQFHLSADIRYKKMLLVLIEHFQKPPVLKATSLLDFTFFLLMQFF